jgi:hypothetical protein
VNWREITADACAVIAFGAAEEIVRRTVGGKLGRMAGTIAGGAAAKWVHDVVLDVLNRPQPGIA